ncbi:MAG TPA: hypothetical protein DCG75_02025 [Bacteroidales bacterium]|nr:hypothetical protein [Bacteroidales bacterium]
MNDLLDKIEISFEELKSLVFEYLKESKGTLLQIVGIESGVARVALRKGLVRNPYPSNFQGGSSKLDEHDKTRVREIVWDLIIQRVLTIGGYNNPEWPFLSLTEYGLEVIESELPIPNDISGYLSRINSEISNLDKVILDYLEESIKTYNINQLLSSTITLGCASEKALLILIDTYGESFEDIEKGNAFKNKIDKKLIKAKFEIFNEDLKRNIQKIHSELKEDYQNTLTGIFEMIRRNRNEAGHPTGKKVDKEILFAHLQVFIPYCKYVYRLIDFFENNKH